MRKLPPEEKKRRQREYHRRWRAKNLEKIRAYSRNYLRQWRLDNPERARLIDLKCYYRDPVLRLLALARGRAKKRGLPYNLEPSDVSIPTHCPVLGIALVHGLGTGFQDASPTLDRIDNDRGYVRGKVVVVSWRANRIKVDATLDELRALVAFYSRYEGEEQCYA